MTATRLALSSLAIAALAVGGVVAVAQPPRPVIDCGTWLWILKNHDRQSAQPALLAYDPDSTRACAVARWGVNYEQHGAMHQSDHERALECLLEREPTALEVYDSWDRGMGAIHAAEAKWRAGTAPAWCGEAPDSTPTPPPVCRRPCVLTFGVCDCPVEPDPTPTPTPEPVATPEPPLALCCPSCQLYAPVEVPPRVAETLEILSNKRGPVTPWKAAIRQRIAELVRWAREDYYRPSTLSTGRPTQCLEE